MSAPDPGSYAHWTRYLTERIGALSGAGDDLVRPGTDVYVPGTRYEFDVLGIGREDKRPPAPPTDTEAWRIPFEDLLVGAHTYRIPVSFRIGTVPGAGLGVRLGTWTASPGEDETCRRRCDVLVALLRTLYPVAITSGARPVAPEPPGLPSGGLATGHPTATAPSAGDNVLPVDRLVRAMTGRRWEVLVLASPEPATTARTVREGLVAELARAADGERAAGGEQPLVTQFEQAAEPVLAHLLDAVAGGSWRTAVYLQAAPDGYPMLASVWRALHTGERSVPEPVRILDLPEGVAADLAGRWAIHRDAAAPDPGRYQRPFAHQSLLSSAQLAALMHLPSLETPGFRVDATPRFDSVVAGSADHVALGTVVPHPGVTPPATGAEFGVSLPSLARHVFIAGVTGSGKTTTCLNLLRGLHRRDVPFLVVEPVKREYRELNRAVPGDPEAERLAAELVVHGVGDDAGPPFHVNPFEVEPGTSVGEHIDLLRAVFAASFGDMWTPLPQVLEQCIRRAYLGRGWDVAADRNHRLRGGDDRGLAFPTLADLAETVDPVVDGLGFDAEARDRVRGSLATRINGLRVGTKGTLFDTRVPLSTAELLARPTVLELERLADASDKAFLVGLLLVRLAGFRRAERRAAAGTGLVLRHVLVIEEAHRLLANVAPVGEDTSRALAVESFSNLLAEVRAYGQGIVVLDQVPTKLAPDVVKNTNLKIAHRIVDTEDRQVVAGAMAMTEEQARALTTLGRGEAAVFGDGDDAPVLIRVAPPPPVGPVVDPVPGPLALLHRGCACRDGGAPECATARRLAEQPEVRRGAGRIATAALHAAAVSEIGVDELISALRREASDEDRQHLVAGCLAAHLADGMADRWGADRSWPFSSTAEFAEALRALLVALLDPYSGSAEALLDYQRHGRALLARRVDPYPGCGEICAGPLAGTCLFRFPAAEAAARPDLLGAWQDARNGDSADEVGYPRTWATCRDVIAPEIVGPAAAPSVTRAAGLCFAQLAAAAETPSWPPWVRQEFVAALVAQADEEEAIEP